MPKSKYAPALFEVIGTRQEAVKTGGGLQVPKWWKSRSSKQKAEDAPPAEAGQADAAPQSETSDQAAPASAGAPEAEPQAAAAPAGATTPTPRFWWRQHAAAEGAEPEAPAPLFRAEGGRVHLSLTPVHAVVACGAVVLALFTCFEMGRLTSRPAATTAVAAAPDDLEKTLQQTPNPAVLNVKPPTHTASRQPTRSSVRAPEAAVKPAAATARPAPEPQPAGITVATPTPITPTPEPAARGAALTYVVLETFSGEDKSAAEFAQKWLEGKGMATRLEQKNGRWRLVSADGFDCSQSAGEQQCVQYREKVKNLGKACSTELRRAKLPIYNLSSPMSFKERAGN